jgi:hypothetical protein
MHDVEMQTTFAKENKLEPTRLVFIVQFLDEYLESVPRIDCKRDIKVL